MIKYNPADKNLSNRIEIMINTQQLILYVNNQVVRNYPVSTSANGISNNCGSDCTAAGWHFVVQLFGENQPVGMIFKSRQATGEIAEIFDDKIKRSVDFVTSRIIRLKGLEPNLNSNSFRRYIYIHGTPEEGLLGTPVSHGCIRMKNSDVIELFDLVSCGMFVNVIV